MPQPQHSLASTQIPTVGPSRQFAVSQRVVETATGRRPDTPRPEEKQQRVTEEAAERPAYPLKRIVEHQLGRPMTISEPLFNAWLTRSLQGRRFARSAEEANEEAKEIRGEVKGLSEELTKLIKEGDGGDEAEIAKLKDQGPAESKKALAEFFDALAKAMKEKPPGKESKTGRESAAVFDPYEASSAAEDAPSATGVAAGAASLPSLLPSIPLSSDLVAGAMAEVIDLKDLVSGLVEAAKAVVDSIPMLGTIVAGVKLLAKGVSLAMLAREAYSVCKAKKSSFSLLEVNVYGAITSYQQEKGIQIGKDMVNLAATGAAAAFGGGSVVSIATKLVDLVAKVAAAIYRAYQANSINEKIRARRPLALQDLRDAPILGLHLPYLDGVDALALLGVAPVGWQASSSAGAIQSGLDASVMQGVLRPTDKGWLTARLQWNDMQTRYRSSLIGAGVRLGGVAVAAAAAPTAEQNPWTREFERVIHMLKWTDTYLYAQKWKLYQDGKVVHEPAPTGLLDRAQEAVKQKATEVGNAVASSVGLPPVSKQGSAVRGGNG